MSNSHTCSYCARTYRLVENYNKHIITCEFFHKSQLQSQDDFQLSVETMPSPREMFLLMRELAHKCSTLEQDVANLKQIVYVRQKKQITEWLNQHRISPSPPSFVEWYETIYITMDHLQRVFDYDLTEGIKYTVGHAIQCSMIRRPISAFSQRSGSIYIYQKQPESEVHGWRVSANEDLERMVHCLERKFLITFVKWQKENQARTAQSEELKDREIMYMIKINGSKITLERRTADVKKWMFSHIEENLEKTVEFV